MELILLLVSHLTTLLIQEKHIATYQTIYLMLAEMKYFWLIEMEKVNA